MNHIKKIGFIGGGNMTKALVGGLLKNNYPKERIIVSDLEAIKLNDLTTQYKIRTSNNNLKIIKRDEKDGIELLFLSVKPDIVPKILSGEIVDSIIQNKPVIISIAAGIQLSCIKKWLKNSNDLKIIRAMPNTPCLIQNGAVGLYCENNVDIEVKDAISQIFQSVASKDAIFYLKKEEHLNIVTAISGSGPAYFFYIVEAMIEEAVKLGLDFDTSYKLITATLMGSGMMILDECKQKPCLERIQLLRKNVTSPNGTTHAAIQVFETEKLKSIIYKAISAGNNRAIEIGNTLSKNS